MKLNIFEIAVECKTKQECLKASLVFQSYGHKWRSKDIHPTFTEDLAYIGITNNEDNTNIPYRIYKDSYINERLKKTVISFETFIQTY